MRIKFIIYIYAIAMTVPMAVLKNAIFLKHLLGVDPPNRNANELTTIQSE